jgi:hypothetical protein
MDANEARQITTTAQERMSHEQLEAIAEQRRLEQAREQELLVEVAEVRALIDAKIIEAAQRGEARVGYEHTVRISAGRNSDEKVSEIKARAAEVINGVVLSLEEEGFSYRLYHPRDERDIRDNVDARPEYHITALAVSWPASAE